MMKKRLVAFGLAGVMLMGMSMNVFAAEDTDVVLDNGSGESTIEFTQNESFSIKIPATIAVNSLVADAPITGLTANWVNLNSAAGKIDVSVTSNKIELTNSDYADIKQNVVLGVTGGTDLTEADGGIVASYTTKTNDLTHPENKIQSLYIKKVNDSEKTIVAGAYTGTIIFTISKK